jgi:hypothetical protein
MSHQSRSAKSACFTFMLETDNDIIGKAHNDDSPQAMALVPPLCPEIEDVMEINIANSGGAT